MLIALSGLPGVGKTTLARALAAALDAVHLRIDTIEQVLRDSGVPVDGEAYRIAGAVAEDNLRLGRIVIADCVNPWPLTRAAWRDVAARAGSGLLEVEVVCTNPMEHRRRVETRSPDIPGHVLPSWTEVLQRDYRPWTTGRLVVDTAHADVVAGVDAIVSAVRAARVAGR
jgi:predicted kinase